MSLSMSRVNRYFAYLMAALSIVGIDQFFKYLAIINLTDSPPIHVLPFLKWHLVYNRGAAFGFLNEAGGFQHYLFVGIALIVTLIILVWLWRVLSSAKLLLSALVLILAGGIGNLIDRFRYRHVVDFINLHYQDWYFPAFNIADMSITFGVVCYVLYVLVAQNNGDK